MNRQRNSFVFGVIALGVVGSLIISSMDDGERQSLENEHTSFFPAQNSTPPYTVPNFVDQSAIVSPPEHPEPSSEGSSEQSKIELRHLLSQYQIPKLTIDLNGNLVVDQQLKFFLEHFTHWLGLEGVSEQELRELSIEQISQVYEGDLLASIESVFDRYWQYTLKLGMLMNGEQIQSAKSEFDGNYSSESTLSLLAEYHDTRDSLRASHFTATEKDTFFGESDRYDAFFKKSLADGHTQNAEHLLSENQLSARKETRILVDLAELETKHSLKPGSEQWHEELGNQYGEETAEKILKIQEKKNDWKDKKASYLSLKEDLYANSALSEMDMASELDRIMKEDLAFSDFEVRRMQALEGRFQQQIN